MWHECSIIFFFIFVNVYKVKNLKRIVKSISTKEGIWVKIEPEERCPISAAVTILFFQKQMPFIFFFLFFKKDKNK